MRIPLATPFKTRTGDTSKDARLKNAYAEVRGDQSVVRHRPSARGGVSISTGTAQGGIGFTLGGVDYLYTFNNDVGSLNTASVGTTWSVGTSYSIGDHVSYGFIDYWALTDHTGSPPPSADWSTSYVPAVPKTYATWNHLDSGIGVILSNGNLSMQSNSGSSRSTLGKSSGKWYWEVLQTPTSGRYGLSPGIALSTFNKNFAVGVQSGSIGYWGMNNNSPGQIRVEGAVIAYVSGYTDGDIIGIALDRDSGTVSFYKNGIFIYTVTNALITSGIIYAALGATQNENVFGTTNFGASAFSYTVPSGYNSGLYV